MNLWKIFELFNWLINDLICFNSENSIYTQSMIARKHVNLENKGSSFTRKRLYFPGFLDTCILSSLSGSNISFFSVETMPASKYFNLSYPFKCYTFNGVFT